MQLDTKRLIDAGITDADMVVIFGAFDMMMSGLEDTIEGSREDLPFTDNDLDRVKQRTQEVAAKIKAWEDAKVELRGEQFMTWFQSGNQD